jgi:MoxR-like ATPase
MSNLYWAMDGTSWRLTDVSGKIHSCKDAKFNPPKYEDPVRGQKDPNAEQIPFDIGDTYQSGEGQGQQGSEGQAEGQEQRADSQQEQQGQSEGQSGSGQGDGDCQILTTKDPMSMDQVYEALKPSVKAEIAMAVGAHKQQMDARFGRNEQAMKDAINKHVQQKLDEIEGPAPVIQVTLPDGTPKGEPTKTTHPAYPELLILMSMRENVLLVGPAGTGKTTAAEHAASALGLKFYPFSVGAQTSKTDIAGYQDAHSRLVRSIFREAYEHGGCFLLDEVDAGNANVLTLMNSSLANGYFSFPDQVVKKHPDFVCVAAANTYGNGADRQYVGRNQLDAATLDRFMFLDWEYDTKLEKTLSKGYDEWREYVWKLRKAREKTGVRAVFSTRAVAGGARLLATGKFSRERVEAIALWKGISRDDKEKLIAAL